MPATSFTAPASIIERCAWYGVVADREKTDRERQRKPDDRLAFVL